MDLSHYSVWIEVFGCYLVNTVWDFTSGLLCLQAIIYIGTQKFLIVTVWVKHVLESCLHVHISSGHSHTHSMSRHRRKLTSDYRALMLAVIFVHFSSQWMEIVCREGIVSVGSVWWSPSILMQWMHCCIALVLVCLHVWKKYLYNYWIIIIVQHLVLFYLCSNYHCLIHDY